jgi:hypothetical protein
MNVGIKIAGLAFNPGTGHLFVIASTGAVLGTPDVYVLDTKNAYNIIGAFFITDGTTKVFASGGQAGLEADCDGNLWAVNQNAQKVYKAASGETGFCNYQATWLSATPATGSIAVAGNAPLTVSVNSTGLTAGIHNAYLRVVSNTPYGNEIVPVTLKVNTLLTATFKSTGVNDGWVLESSQTSEKGGTKNSTDATFNVGDDAANKQYRGILSFNTGSLPGNAVVTSAALSLKTSSVVGSPFADHGNLILDIRNPFFGTSAALTIGDFQALASKSSVGRFALEKPVNSWYFARMASGLHLINVNGTTQFRIRFRVNDDNDLSADFARFFSGNAPLELRPTLTVLYYIP